MVMDDPTFLYISFVESYQINLRNARLRRRSTVVSSETILLIDVYRSDLQCQNCTHGVLACSMLAIISLLISRSRVPCRTMVNGTSNRPQHDIGNYFGACIAPQTLLILQSMGCRSLRNLRIDWRLHLRDFRVSLPPQCPQA